MQRPLLLASAVGDFLASGCHFEGFGSLGVLGASTSAFTGTATFESCTINVQYPTAFQEWQDYPFADAFLVNTMPVVFKGCAITTNASTAPRLLRFYNQAPIAFTDFCDLTAWGGSGTSYPMSFLRPQFVSTEGCAKLVNAAGQLEYVSKPMGEVKDPHTDPAAQTFWTLRGGVTINPGPNGTATITSPLVSMLNVGDMIGSYDWTDIAAWMPKLYHNEVFAGDVSRSLAIGKVHSINGSTATLIGVGQNWPNVDVDITMVTLETVFN